MGRTLFEKYLRRMLKFLILVLTLTSIQNVMGHGRLRYPPSRASMWRDGFPNPADYNDNQGFCGGAMHQQSLGGKCGICGDPWDGPKPHEVPGRYANGIIVDTFKSGQEVEVTVQITTNHKGYFEFKFYPGYENKNYLPVIKLPDGLTCSRCILQWTYITGNSWACDPDTGECCTGCNPLKQEHFRACSDIAISANGESP